MFLYYHYIKVLSLVSFERSSNCGAIDVKMDGPVLDEKSSFKDDGTHFLLKIGLVLLTR